VALGDELGLSLGPHARVRALTPAERHQVELLALAHRGASVLLLDDWLAGLTEDPTEELLLALAKLRATGRTVLVATRPGGPLLDLLTWRTGSPGWRTAAWPGAGARDRAWPGSR
jgi:energy-coupling factor transporter ATP-binding protein EcfA2